MAVGIIIATDAIFEGLPHDPMGAMVIESLVDAGESSYFKQIPKIIELIQSEISDYMRQGDIDKIVLCDSRGSKGSSTVVEYIREYIAENGEILKEEDSAESPFVLSAKIGGCKIYIYVGLPVPVSKEIRSNWSVITESE